LIVIFILEINFIVIVIVIYILLLKICNYKLCLELDSIKAQS